MRKWVTPVWARLSPVAVRGRRPKLGMVGLGRDRRQVPALLLVAARCPLACEVWAFAAGLCCSGSRSQWRGSDSLPMLLPLVGPSAGWQGPVAVVCWRRGDSTQGVLGADLCRRSGCD